MQRPNWQRRRTERSIVGGHFVLILCYPCARIALSVASALLTINESSYVLSTRAEDAIPIARSISHKLPKLALLAFLREIGPAYFGRRWMRFSSGWSPVGSVS